MEHARPPTELSLEGGPACRATAWRKWCQQFLVFLKASGVNKEAADIQANLLVNLIGPEGYNIYSTFRYTKDESREDINILVQKFNDHFGTKQNTTMVRFKFFTRNQESGESIDDFVTTLKNLSEHCEFEHLEESLIRDRIVCGVSNSKVRDRLLRSEELTLQTALKICRAHEMSREEKENIECIEAKTEGTSASSSREVDVIRGARAGWRTGGWTMRDRRGRGALQGHIQNSRNATVRRYPREFSDVTASRACSRCGGFYCNGSSYCPAFRAGCFRCGLVGHFQKLCTTRPQKSVNEIVDDEEELYDVSMIYGDISKNEGKWYETLQVHSSTQKEIFKLDTGSDLNVISLSRYKQLGFSLSYVNQHDIRARSFCGNEIPILGSCYINWIYKNNPYSIKFCICKNDCQSVLGKYACEELGIVKRVFSINIDKFICKYADLFKGLGKLPGVYKIFINPEIQPSVCPVRKIPIGVRDKLKVELERMEDMGVIRKVSHPTDWVNAIVVAAKKNGSIRICLDPRPLNKAIRRAHYSLPTLMEIASKLQGARYFSKLDARSGFWMLQIDDESADLCTFGTPFGRYQFLRLPFGINCASEVFHSRIRQILEDLDGVDSFIDDIIVWGTTIAQHDERLKCLFDRARQVGIKFNKEKCEFRVEKVSYLGHTFSFEGMAIDKNKLKAIEHMPTPQNRSDLERFLGMVNYLSKFIENYSEIASPLRGLLKKDVEWFWEEAHDKAVRELKQRLCAAPVLALYSPCDPVLLTVDASSRALGAALLQRGKPVEFASSTLTDAQTRYAQIEKELLAIVFALERFHQYLFGRGDVTIETDHKPLEALFKKPLDAVPARLQRMMLRIQGYSFKVMFKPGKYMFIADTLSRAPLPDLMKSNVSIEVEEQTCFVINNVRFSDEKINWVKNGIEVDRECQFIIKYIKDGWPENKYDADESVRRLWGYRECFEYIDGLILKDNLVYIPQGLRADMIKRVHEGHMGIDRCKRRAREVMFWPGMSGDVERAVRRCVTCAEQTARPLREPMVPHKIPDIPWSKVGSDIFQFRDKKFLILVDYFSNFIEVSSLGSIGSKAVIQAMKDQFSRHGIPAQLITDNGPAYSSREFAEFRSKWGFTHITTSPNYPQANGRSEKSVQTIKKMLVKANNSGSDFYLGLLNFRACPRDGISSPAELLMGRKLNTRLPVYEKLLRPSRDNTSDYENILHKQNQSKRYYDQHSRPLPRLFGGQNVVMVDEANGRKRATVQGAAPQPRSYFVKDNLTGRQFRRNRRHLICVPSLGETATPSRMQKDEESSSAEGDCSPQGIYDDPIPSTSAEIPKLFKRNVEPRPAAVKARIRIKSMK